MGQHRGPAGQAGIGTVGSAADPAAGALRQLRGFGAFVPPDGCGDHADHRQQDDGDDDGDGESAVRALTGPARCSSVGVRVGGGSFAWGGVRIGHSAMLADLTR